jgi:hypothetical protein
MSLTIQISDEQAALLQANAAAQGLSLEAWLQKLAEEKPAFQEPSQPGTGQFQREHGLWVYRTGDPMPPSLVNETLAQIRQEREAGFLGTLPE